MKPHSHSQHEDTTQGSKMPRMMTDEPPQDDNNAEVVFENELIALVKTQEVLFNKQHSAYKDVNLKKKIWEDLATKLKRPVDQCQMKWRVLCQQYTQVHKRLLCSDNANFWQRWKHYESLAFLESYVRQGNELTSSMLDISTSSEIMDQEEMNPMSTTDNGDEIFHFFWTMAVMTRNANMPPTVFADLQKNIRQLISKAMEN